MTPEQLDRFIAEDPLFATTKAFRRIMRIIEAEAPPAERKPDWIAMARKVINR